MNKSKKENVMRECLPNDELLQHLRRMGVRKMEDLLDLGDEDLETIDQHLSFIAKSWLKRGVEMAREMPKEEPCNGTIDDIRAMQLDLDENWGKKSKPKRTKITSALKRIIETLTMYMPRIFVDLQFMLPKPSLNRIISKTSTPVVNQRRITQPTLTTHFNRRPIRNKPYLHGPYVRSRNCSIRHLKSCLRRPEYVDRHTCALFETNPFKELTLSMVFQDTVYPRVRLNLQYLNVNSPWDLLHLRKGDILHMRVSREDMKAVYDARQTVENLLDYSKQYFECRVNVAIADIADFALSQFISSSEHAAIRVQNMNSSCGFTPLPLKWVRRCERRMDELRDMSDLNDRKIREIVKDTDGYCVYHPLASQWNRIRGCRSGLKKVHFDKENKVFELNPDTYSIERSYYLQPMIYDVDPNEYQCTIHSRIRDAVNSGIFEKFDFHSVAMENVYPYLVDCLQEHCTCPETNFSSIAKRRDRVEWSDDINSSDDDAKPYIGYEYRNEIL